MENILLIADSSTIFDLEYKRESQSIVEPRLALRSAPPNAKPLTFLSLAIREILFIAFGVSNNAIMLISGRLSIKEQSSIFGSIKALTERSVLESNFISS